MKQQTALVFLLLFSYVLQIDYFVNSDTEPSVNLSTGDRFFRRPKQSKVCNNDENSLNISKCFNTSLVENDETTMTISLGNEEAADLYR